jgi:hypothetical protein
VPPPLFLVTVVVCSRHLVSGKRGVGGPDMCYFKDRAIKGVVENQKSQQRHERLMGVSRSRMSVKPS